MQLILLGVFIFVYGSLKTHVYCQELSHSPAVQISTCNIDTWNQCSSVLAAALDLDSFPTDSSHLLAAFEILLENKGAQGFIQSCRALTELRVCLGPDAYSSCISVPFFYQNVVSNAEFAYGYASVFAQLNYQCGPAFPAILNNINCYAPIYLNHTKAIETCESSYLQSCTNDPSMCCGYSVLYAMCTSGPFYQSCGSATGWAVCASSAAAVLPRSRNCYINCDGILHTSTCDNARMDQCLNTYGGTIGMRSFLRDPRAYLAFMQQNLWSPNGQQNFATFCVASQRFVLCLAESTSDCLSLAHLQTLGYNQSDAILWTAIMQLVQYECGTGYRTLYSNFPCYLLSVEQAKSTLDACVQTFSQQLVGDIPNICDDAQEFMKCYMQPFLHNCSAGPNNVLCVAIQGVLNVLLPQCSPHCLV